MQATIARPEWVATWQPREGAATRLRSSRTAGLWRALTVACVLAPLGAATHAWQVKAAADKLDARGWVQRMAEATSSANYAGTMVFSVGGTTTSSRVTRYCVGPQSYEWSESLDGPARRIYRHNQLVHTLWPDRKVAVVEQRDALSPFPALPVGASSALTAYELKLEGRDRVAAHEAQVVVLTPRDSGRYMQRLWADVSTGLMLRAEVLDTDGRVLESSSFSDLKLGVRPQPDLVLAAMHRLDGFKVVRAEISRTRLEDEGWRLPVPVDGFKQVSCVSRPLNGGPATPGAPAMLQSIYSDGLVHVSVFIEPYDPGRHKPSMSSWGATHALSQQRGDHWITIVGDVPAATIRQFASALEKLR